MKFKIEGESAAYRAKVELIDDDGHVHNLPIRRVELIGEVGDIWRINLEVLAIDGVEVSLDQLKSAGVTVTVVQLGEVGR